MDDKQNPFTLDWVADTFLDLLIKGQTVDPVATMRGLLEARAEFEQALQSEAKDPKGQIECDETFKRWVRRAYRNHNESLKSQSQDLPESVREAGKPDEAPSSSYR